MRSLHPRHALPHRNSAHHGEASPTAHHSDRSHWVKREVRSCLQASPSHPDLLHLTVPDRCLAGRARPYRCRGMPRLANPIHYMTILASAYRDTAFHDRAHPCRSRPCLRRTTHLIDRSRWMKRELKMTLSSLFITVPVQDRPGHCGPHQAAARTACPGHSRPNLAPSKPRTRAEAR